MVTPSHMGPGAPIGTLHSGTAALYGWSNTSNKLGVINCKLLTYNILFIFRQFIK